MRDNWVVVLAAIVIIIAAIIYIIQNVQVQ